MAFFEELNTNINIVLENIFEDQDLCKLIYYNEPNPLSQANISDTTILLFDRVFPYPKKPRSESYKGTDLNIYYSASRPQSNNAFRNTILCFDIMCHIDVWKIDSALRPYSISAKIDTIFNRLYNTDLSINYIFFENWIPVQFSDYYYGYHLKYILSDNSNLGCD